MNKIGVMLIAVFTFSLVSAAQVSADTYDLIAGQNYNAGSVEVWNDNQSLFVKYMVNEGWMLEGTHFAYGEELTDIPQTKKGNPKIGNFAYSSSHDPSVTEHTYEISLDDVPMDFYGAAHAVVTDLSNCEEVFDLEGFNAGLADSTIVKVAYPWKGVAAYFPNVYLYWDEGRQDTQGWCMDVDRGIDRNTQYEAMVYSTYEDLPFGLLTYPENTDLVNWVINQGYVYSASPGCEGNYTYGDVQRAIWTLVDDNVYNITDPQDGTGIWSQCRVDEIVADAYANGEGFVPGCGDVIGIILDPVNGAQPVLAEIPVECELMCSSETAWAAGNPFPGNSWATYFMYSR